MQIPIMIRFLLSDVELPRPPKISIGAADTESQRSIDRSGPPPNVSEAEEILDQVSELPGPSPIPQMRGMPIPAFDNPGMGSLPATSAVPGTGTASFRGHPINVDRPIGPGPPRTSMRRDEFDSHEGEPLGGHGGAPTQPRRGPYSTMHPSKLPSGVHLPDHIHIRQKSNLALIPSRIT